MAAAPKLVAERPTPQVPPVHTVHVRGIIPPAEVLRQLQAKLAGIDVGPNLGSARLLGTAQADVAYLLDQIVEDPS